MTFDWNEAIINFCKLFVFISILGCVTYIVFMEAKFNYELKVKELELKCKSQDAS